MTRKLLFSLCIVIVAAVSIAATTRILPVLTEEVIIIVPEAEAGRNDQTISDALAAIPGVTVVDYCNSQHCFYLNVDRSQQSDNRVIIDTVRGLGYALDFKTSGTIQEAQSNCADRQ